MGANYYAVRVGNRTGIFTTLVDFELTKKGYANWQGRGFKSYDKALEYMRGEQGMSDTEKSVNFNPVKLRNSNEVNMYCDGSYASGHVAYGVYVETLYGKFTDCGSTIISLNGSYYAECLGFIAGISLCGSLGYKVINVYYDCQGLNCINTKDTEDEDMRIVTKALVQTYNLVKDKYGLTINMIKVPSHTGIAGNELADRLASEAIARGIKSKWDEIWNGTYTHSSSNYRKVG